VSRRPAKQPQFDREDLRELARCYARAAVDQMILETTTAEPIADENSAQEARNDRDRKNAAAVRRRSAAHTPE
jgi:hypothetical protein